MRLRRTITTIAATAALLGVASPALATERNGSCERGELCLHYNSNLAGSFTDFYYKVPNFGTYKFLTPGSGQGQYVKNNAASARNKAWWCTARIYYNSSYVGIYDDVAAGQSRNLFNTKNENASFSWRC